MTDFFPRMLASVGHFVTSDTVVASLAVLILAVAAGLVVSRSLNAVTTTYRKPRTIDSEDWSDFVKSTDWLLGGGNIAACVLGNLERLLFVGAFRWGEPTLIAVWMAVKVATKWQSWAGLFLEIETDDSSGIPQLYAQRYLRWRVSQRFLIGSLLNILFAAAISFVVFELFGSTSE